MDSQEGQNIVVDNTESNTENKQEANQQAEKPMSKWSKITLWYETVVQYSYWFSFAILGGMLFLLIYFR